jgi:hypothetical protein
MTRRRESAEERKARMEAAINAAARSRIEAIARLGEIAFGENVPTGKRLQAIKELRGLTGLTEARINRLILADLEESSRSKRVSTEQLQQMSARGQRDELLDLLRAR